MLKEKRITSILVLLIIGFSTSAQNCDCFISQVKTNTVMPCNYTVGAIDTIYTEAQFVTAVNQANNNGGNITILIANGTYEIASTSWYPYITANNVVFRSLSGNRDSVILTGSGMRDVSPGVEIGISAQGDNIVIADLTIRDIGNHAISVSGSNVFVYNVKIQDTYEQMIKGSSSQPEILNGIVKCSLFEYTNGVGPQWYIGGLDIHKGVNWLVSDNVFKDISSPSVAVAEHAIHFWDFSSNNIVERNEIFNCDRGIGFGLGNSPNIGGIIKNNMITNDGSGIFHDVGIGLETSPNTKVFNNSIFIQYQNAIEYRFTATEQVEIMNNVTNKLIRSRNGGTATLSNNVDYALDSWFVDVSKGDLRLNNNITSLVNGGSPLTEVTVDIDKNNRPQNSDYDIGAFEYSVPINTSTSNSSNSNMTFFPNPATEHITFKSEDDFTELIIYNAVGKEILNYFTSNLSKGSTIAISHLPNGIYVGLLRCENETLKSIKFVINR